MVPFLPPAMTICDSDEAQMDANHQSRHNKAVNLSIDRYIERVSKRTIEGETKSFFIADLTQVTRQHMRWMRNLPTVRPYYAVKCNSDLALLRWLASLGTGFDCASTQELSLVLDLNVDPANIIFANPVKAPAALLFAREVGAARMTFDNLDELDKIASSFPEAQLLLRIYASDDGALVSLGEKFGAQLDTTEQLIARAWELRLNVVGVSFHVGTGAKSSGSFRKAIQDAGVVFNRAEAIGFQPSILDIGGGFQDSNFEYMASAIREFIAAHFPPNVTIIAEPGRYFARSAYTLVSQVIGRRHQMGSVADEGLPDMLYQNDGVYGNFMNVVMEKERMVPQLYSTSRKPEGQGEECKGKYRYSIWGPTCDSIDCVAREATFDSEVQVGDRLVYHDMGAYTITTATRFNGFSGSSDIVYVNSEALSGQN
ncbi:putative ornithine decarboxylase [Aspergillus pseudoustus]|uniref:ornithine decarboxylase n=1 Tax=Aspergillus pseudoustus TaxID=1810923 RepID=A0ABR4JES0_9EURO